MRARRLRYHGCGRQQPDETPRSPGQCPRDSAVTPQTILPKPTMPRCLAVRAEFEAATLFGSAAHVYRGIGLLFRHGVHAA